jgi:hydroxymethylglutaryl-CoA reductase
MTNSRISGFYNMTIEERRAKLRKRSPLRLRPILPRGPTGGLSPEAADHMIENVIGMYSLPLGIG